MIVGLVAITPGAGFVNGWGAIVIGVIAATIVYFALNYLSRVAPFRGVDDTLGVVYTHGFAGLAGGLLVGIFANSAMAETVLAGTISGGGLHLLGWQALTALWVIVFSAIGTFILLKLVGLFVPLRMTEEEMETGDIAVHGHEVYPSDVPSLGFPDGVPAARPAAGLALGSPLNDPRPTKPPPASGADPSSGARPVGAAAAAASRRTSSIVATAGVTAAAAGCRGEDLAHRAARAQLPDLDVLAGGREGQLAGSARRRPRRDQALDDLVVVAFERDPRLEAAAWQERTTCRAQGLASEVWTQASSRRSSRRRLPARGQRVAARQRQVQRVLEAAGSGACPASSRSPTPSNSNSRTRSNSPRAGAGRSPPARPRRGSARRPGARRGSRRSPAASGSRRRSGRRPCAGGRRGRRRSPPTSSSAASIRARIPSAWPASAAPAAVGRAPPRSRSISGAPTSRSSVAIACETADCE